MALMLLFGALGGAVTALIVVLLRRGRSDTETAEGLRIEERARLQASMDRVSYNSFAVHNAPPTQSDSYRPHH
ncbi:hypothetical protein [Streptomyces roseolus]|uniref:hypothetical protein n=1 Tax=Streptomyces roseolus TaxID=67358 RepID=UPI001679A9D7|nr:hypothetical protein [Streptomyces roseolus]GGR46217.1 hypothetical protein GCM10010282_43820 [Streptomyces roseolus]